MLISSRQYPNVDILRDASWQSGDPASQAAFPHLIDVTAPTSSAQLSLDKLQTVKTYLYFTVSVWQIAEGIG